MRALSQGREPRQRAPVDRLIMVDTTLGWRPLGKMESEPAVLEPLERSIRSSFLSRSFEGGQREG